MKKLGEGGQAEIFVLDDLRLLKLYHEETSGVLDREVMNLRIVGDTGLPVPAVDEVIEIAGRRGIVFSGISPGVTLRAKVRRRPWTMNRCAATLAALHASVHERRSLPLPSQREVLAGYIEASTVLSPRLQRAALDRLWQLPDGDTLCHGDLHLDNVIVTRDDLFLIDWFRATSGDARLDVAYTVICLRLGSLPKRPLERVALRASRAAFSRAYLRRYLRRHASSRDEIRLRELPVAAALTGRAKKPERVDELVQLVELRAARV